jgi:V/A-type H+-transporting ATPase subunit F
MEIAVIADEHSATAFRLAGVRRVYDDRSGADRLQSLLAEGALGMLIVTERVADQHRKAIDDHKASKRIAPIVVEVPDVNGPIKRDVDPIRELIRRAIGADVTARQE